MTDPNLEPLGENPPELRPGERIILLVRNEQRGTTIRVGLVDPTDTEEVQRRAEGYANLGHPVAAIVTSDSLDFLLAVRPYTAHDSLFASHGLCICNDPKCDRSKAIWN